MHQSTPENRRALSRTLDRWRREKGWSQSDLARAVFGTTPNPKNGNPIAAGRDNVSKWLSGASFPEPENLTKLSEITGIPETKLVAPVAAPAPGQPSVQLVQVRSHPGVAHLILDLTVSRARGLEMMGLLAGADIAAELHDTGVVGLPGAHGETGVRISFPGGGDAARIEVNALVSFDTAARAVGIVRDIRAEQTP